MKVRTAELAAAPGRSQDRVFITESAVVVLDGASGTDTAITVVQYVTTLGRCLTGQLDEQPDAPLSDVLTAALTATIAQLDVRPGDSPSSTVAIARIGTTTVDMLVLGDSPIYLATRTGIKVVSDQRLARLPIQSRAAVLARLAAGAGLDDTHYELLAAMRREKAPLCNVEHGYWIAEADPAAGAHALTRTLPRTDVLWCALLTDGAYEPLSHLGISMTDLAELDNAGLADVLTRLHDWEAQHDPNGKQLPRFKRHDDKTIAIMDLR